MDLDSFTPILMVTFAVLTLALSFSPKVKASFTQSHPLRRSFAQFERSAWILGIVGSLWCLQNLLL